jgi:DNA helicase-2/ATP-dependent DNA helicase PcrA
MRSRFLDEIPAELTDAEEAPEPTSWEASTAPETAPLPFHVGDDVLHATFGEGVVTGIEEGRVVVVRFAESGSERKLMADYAPLTRKRRP